MEPEHFGRLIRSTSLALDEEQRDLERAYLRATVLLRQGNSPNRHVKATCGQSQPDCMQYVKRTDKIMCLCV